MSTEKRSRPMAAGQFAIALVIPFDSRKSIRWWQNVGAVQLETIVRSHGRRIHGSITHRLERGDVSRMIVACDTRPAK